MVAAEEAQGQACVGPSDRQGWVQWQVGAGQSLSTVPGSSLVSVCQRSIRLSLFFRQSNQCFRRSPLALMPRTTPPAGGKFRGQPGAWGRCSHESIPLEPVPPPLHVPRLGSPSCPRGSKGGQWHTLGPQDQGLGPCRSSTQDQGRETKEPKRARAALLCAAASPQGLGSQGLRVQPEVWTITTSHACSTTDSCVTPRPVSCSATRSWAG